MQETNLREETAGLVAGRLEGMSVPDLMWLLCRRRATGVLHLHRGAVIKKIYFQDGHIIFAASSDSNDRLGEMLLRDGLIGLEQLEAAIANLHLGKRLGTLLVEMGHLRPEDLVRGVMTQVREIVLEVFTWEEGAYRLDEGPLPTQEVITLGMKTGEILLQGIRRIRSFTRIRRSVGGPRQRFVLSPRWAEVMEGLDLTDAERLLLLRLQRGSASIGALCREIYSSNFEIHQALWALKVLGAVEEADGAGESSVAGASVEGRLGSEGIIEVVVRLCRAGETGVLHVTKGSAERTFHLREGRCVFATSNNIDDGLIAHLLRRGVISIRDREETAKRLLSNKRVGTILLEMGVLDERDLREMVREQLSEIVCDTFRWQDGEYSFVPGELPTFEDIVLEMSLEDLITEGIRRVTSWSRVRAGCGGTGQTPFALTEDYLDVLDRMTVGAGEWEVVSCLSEPKTLIDLCRRTTLGDFRVCQILWALRLLGAVREEGAAGVTDAVPSTGEHVSLNRPTLNLAPAPADEAAGAHEAASPAGAVGNATGVPPENVPADGAETTAVAAPAEVEAIPVALADAAPAELVSETWRLTGEDFPAPLTGDVPPTATEAAQEQRAGEAPAALAEPSAVEAASQDAAPHPEDVPPLDSPADATLVMSRAEVEAALGLAAPVRDGAEFELAEPGTGTDAQFAEALAKDAAGGQEFEIGEPLPEAAEPPEPGGGPSAEPGPDFEVAKEPRTSKTEARHPVASPAAAEDEEQTGAIPAEVVARALGVAPEETQLAADAPPVAAAPVQNTAGENESVAAPRRPAEPRVEPQEAPAREPEPAASEAGTDVMVAAPAGVLAAEPSPEDPLADLDAAINRFNHLHRVLYRAIRSEVGAGTVNFIQACRFGLADGHGELFAGSRLMPDGTWDPEGLKKAMRQRQEREPWNGLEGLLNREIEMLTPQIDDARVRALREQLAELRRTR